jgi:hypothetical protein
MNKIAARFYETRLRRYKERSGRETHPPSNSQSNAWIFNLADGSSFQLKITIQG